MKSMKWDSDEYFNLEDLKLMYSGIKFTLSEINQMIQSTMEGVVQKLKLLIATKFQERFGNRLGQNGCWHFLQLSHNQVEHYT